MIGLITHTFYMKQGTRFATLQFYTLATSAAIMGLALSQIALAESVKFEHQGADLNVSRLWAHDNLYVWDVVDSVKRGPEERAQLLERLGFKRYAYFSGSEVVTKGSQHELKDFHGDPEAQIMALQRHGIDVMAWFFWDGADTPQVQSTFELFKRHHIHPQIWMTQEYAWISPNASATLHRPTREESKQLLLWNEADAWNTFHRLNEEELPKTVNAQRLRIAREAARIKPMAELAAKYGCTVALYNHEGRWFGNEDNELAIVTDLEQAGITNVGLVYNFSHAINYATVETDYDDSKDFAQLWGRIKVHVVAVNITAVGGEGIDLSQGKSELDMMRIIQESGWHGPIGVEVHHPGDTAMILRNDLIALDWLAAELTHPGSGGPRPRLRDPEVRTNY